MRKTQIVVEIFQKRMKLVDLRTLISHRIAKMRELLCISVGFICGAAPFGNKTKRNSFLGQINCYR